MEPIEYTLDLNSFDWKSNIDYDSISLFSDSEPNLQIFYDTGAEEENIIVLTTQSFGVEVLHVVERIEKGRIYKIIYEGLLGAPFRNGFDRPVPAEMFTEAVECQYMTPTAFTEKYFTELL